MFFPDVRQDSSVNILKLVAHFVVYISRAGSLTVVIEGGEGEPSKERLPPSIREPALAKVCTCVYTLLHVTGFQFRTLILIR